ncbi:MAG TPA: zf-HC2 domain-containing protein [Holophagaceae bacterium]|nr:zf-HC2 domain-containing protein [Holophagaceae bacterium]
MDESFVNPEALTQAILARTSGSPCQRLRALACDFVDGELDGAQEDLVRGHAEHCAACAALVKALAESKAVLPALAEVDPGPWFMQRVLRSTSMRAVEPGFDARAAWRKLMHRPRIALEAAYLGAVAGMMGMYAPVPWRSLELPALVQTVPLKAPAQRVMGQVIQAEQRTSASLRRVFLPRVEASPSANLWQRVSARVRSWLQRLEKVLKPSNAANP